MSEILKAEGKIEEISEVGSGVKKDGTPWTRYKYKIGNRYYAGFIDLKKTEPPQKIGDTVIVAYSETPNPNGTNPYKNVRNVTPTVSNEELKESNEAVNLVPVGTEQKAITEEERWEKINAIKDRKIMFGQVLNKTMDWIMNERRITQTPEVTLDKNFNSMFDHIWKLATEKRKEKLK